MIQIELREKGERFCCRAQGHADYAQEGEDIVCAAVSSLLWAMKLALVRLQREGRGEILSQELAPGRAELCFCARGDGRIRARELWRTVGDGLLFVEEEFPRCVQVHRTAPKGAERGECA